MIASNYQYVYERQWYAARQSGWKWSVNLDEKRPAGL